VGGLSGASCVAPFWWPFEWHQACSTLAGSLGSAILGDIELLLWKGRQQQAQPFQLSRRKNAVEQPVKIGERDQLAPAIRRPNRCAVSGTWSEEFGQEVVRQIEINVEPLQVSPVLLLERVDQEVRKDKPPSWCLGCGRGLEPLRIGFWSRIWSGVIAASRSRSRRPSI